MEFSVCKKFEISYAHHLPGYEGPCETLHGHNAIIELTYTSKSLSVMGMVKDFSDIKAGLEDKVKKKMDHKCLNDIPFFYKRAPTAEHMCLYIVQELADDVERYELSCIRVWEDRDSYAELKIKAD